MHLLIDVIIDCFETKGKLVQILALKLIIFGIVTSFFLNHISNSIYLFGKKSTRAEILIVIFFAYDF